MQAAESVRRGAQLVNWILLLRVLAARKMLHVSNVLRRKAALESAFRVGCMGTQVLRLLVEVSPGSTRNNVGLVNLSAVQVDEVVSAASRLRLSGDHVSFRS